MWRTRSKPTPLSLLFTKTFCSSTPPTSLYSFLKPSLFTLPKTPSHPPPQTPPPPNKQTNTPLTQEQKTHLESTLLHSLTTSETDVAWQTFKAMTTNSTFPGKDLTNMLITHLSSLHDVHNLKRAYAAVVYMVEKNPVLLEHETVRRVLVAMCREDFGGPVFALVKCMLKNRFFVGFDVWGDVVVEISGRGGGGGRGLKGYLGLFYESCRVVLEEKVEVMRPSLRGCNAALKGCCVELESVGDAERVVELMADLDVRPDETSFGFLGYLYALKGMEEKVVELEGMMGGFGFEDKVGFLSRLVGGYVKKGDLEMVSKTLLRSLEGRGGEGSGLGEEVFCDVVKGFLKHGSVKDLADLIVEAQLLEHETVVAEKTIGFGIVNACVSLGMLGKGNDIVDEINARGATVGVGVYLSILRAYGKELRTAEAAHLVAQLSSSGLQLDAGCYDSLIEASMTSQDFQSAFSLYRDMRDARLSELKASYLTIMTGLTENNRPELMAAFLDEVVEDPRIEVGTHDWNSIIHAFVKAGRLEDARRTFRRMAFLQYVPNEQTYLSLINGYVSAGKYFNVLMLWNEVKRRASHDDEKRFRLVHSLVDAFLYALVKGGFFDAVMQVVEKAQELRVFVDKWRYKQAFMESHKKLKVAKLRRKNVKKMEALIAFKNWAGLNA